MVEVYKTNVIAKEDAKRIVRHIHRNFNDVKANFDLEECDNILRVKFGQRIVDPATLIQFVKCFGFDAEVLTD